MRTREEQLEELTAIGFMYRHYMRLLNAQRSALRESIEQALVDDITIQEIAECTKLTRMTIYNLNNKK